MKQPEQEIPVDWVEVKAFAGAVFAEMAKELLENNQIPCFLKKDFFSSAYGIQGSEGIGAEARLFVPKEKLKESHELIATLMKEDD